MKKIITYTLCSMALMTAGAQKANVEQAKKLSGKPEKIEEARSLIKEAIANPETSAQPLTYHTAGKIEWDAYDKNAGKQMTNPDAVNPIEMAEELLNGYNYFLEVFPLDELPNEKGEIKPKFTKDLQKEIAKRQPLFWDNGAVLFNEKLYPQAYDAFMIYADMPDLDLLGNQRPVTPDTIRSIAYFNAGIAAWSANEIDKAVVAFKRARENNYSTPDAAIYEIACWQNIQQNDSTRENEARDNIFIAAKGGYDKFGISQPVFLNNMVNSMINSGKENEALTLANDVIASNPDKASLYGLRAYLYDRMKNEDAAEADYRTAAQMNDVDYETMRNAVNKLLRIGQEKWNAIELGDPDIRAKKESVRTNYFEVAKKYAEKAKTLTDDPSDMDYLIESIDYQLSL